MFVGTHKKRGSRRSKFIHRHAAAIKMDIITGKRLTGFVLCAEDFYREEGKVPSVAIAGMSSTSEDVLFY